MFAVSGQCHTGRGLLAGLRQVCIIQLLLLLCGAVAADDDHVLVSGRHIKGVQHLVQRIQRRLTQAGLCTADMVVVRLVVVDAHDLRGVLLHICGIRVDQDQITGVNIFVGNGDVLIDRFSVLSQYQTRCRRPPDPCSPTPVRWV